MNNHTQMNQEPAADLWSAVKSYIEVALQGHPRTDTHHISIEVHGTAVKLSGTVCSATERELAKHAAWGCPGVWNVINNIRVV